MNPATLKERQKFLLYLRTHPGERLTWGKVGKATNMAPNRVVRTLKALLKGGWITEPGGPGSQVYFTGRAGRLPFNVPERLSEEERERRLAEIGPVYHEHDDKASHLRVKDHAWG